jgi:hypothetical protein
MTALEGFVPSWSAEFPNDNPALHEGVTWVCLGVQGPLRPVMRPRAVHAPTRVVETQALTQVDEPRRLEATPTDEAASSSQMDVQEPAPSLEALTLALDMTDESPFADLVSTTACEPLELDAIDFVLTLASEDADFDFDSDDLPPAMTYAATPAADDVATLTVDGAATLTVDGAATLTVDNTVTAAAMPDRGARAPDTEDAFAVYVAAVVGVAEAAGHTESARALPSLLRGTAFDSASLPNDAQARLVAADILCRSGAALSPSDTFTSLASAWRGVLCGDTQDLSACGESTLDGWSADLLRALGVGQGSATDVRRELRRRGVAAFGMLLAA